EVLIDAGAAPKTKDFQEHASTRGALRQAKVGNPEAIAKGENIRLFGNIPVRDFFPKQFHKHRDLGRDIDSRIRVMRHQTIDWSKRKSLWLALRPPAELRAEVEIAA